MKYMVKDYFEAFRWRYMKEFLKKNGWGMLWLVYIVYMPWYNVTGGLRRSMLFWWCVCLPFLFSFFSVNLHPVRMQKLMYLCPMNREERALYVYRSYYFRVGLNMVFSLVGVCVLMVCFARNAGYILEILVNQFLVACLLPTGTDLRYVGKRTVHTDASVYAGIILGVSMVLDMILMEFMLKPGSHSEFALIVLVVMIMFLVFPAVKYVKYIREQLKAAVTYEMDRLDT